MKEETYPKFYVSVAAVEDGEQRKNNIEEWRIMDFMSQNGEKTLSFNVWNFVPLGHLYLYFILYQVLWM